MSNRVGIDHPNSSTDSGPPPEFGNRIPRKTNLVRSILNRSRICFIYFSVLLGYSGFVGAQNLDPNKILADENAVFLAQVNLDILGYDPGPVDRIMGGKTRKALALFQRDFLLSSTGLLDEVTADELAKAAASRIASGSGKDTARRDPPGVEEPELPDIKIPPPVNPLDNPDNQFYRDARRRVVEIARGLKPNQGIMPKNAKRLRNRSEVMEVLGGGVFIEFGRFRTTTLSGQSLSLKQRSWNSYGESTIDKVFTNQPTVHTFEHIIEGSKRCFVDRPVSKPFKFCFEYYVDPIHPGVIYAKGLPKSATNNGNASNQLWLLQKVSDTNQLTRLAAENKARYGDAYVPKPVSSAVIMLELLSLGQAVDDVLRSGTAQGDCNSGSVVASHGGYCPGKEPRFNPATGTYRE